MLCGSVQACDVADDLDWTESSVLLEDDAAIDDWAVEGDDGLSDGVDWRRLVPRCKRGRGRGKNDDSSGEFHDGERMQGVDTRTPLFLYRFIVDWIEPGAWPNRRTLCDSIVISKLCE